MTGIEPPGGVGALIAGSTCVGGQMTPPERAGGSLRLPPFLESQPIRTIQEVLGRTLRVTIA